MPQKNQRVHFYCQCSVTFDSFWPVLFLALVEQSKSSQTQRVIKLSDVCENVERLKFTFYEAYFIIQP